MIENIALTNFKCFDHISLPFSRLNVLTGLNSMGKSSVIQSLLLLKQSYEEVHGRKLNLNGHCVRLGWGKDVLYEKAETEQIGISVTDQGTMYDLCYDYVADADFLLPTKDIENGEKLVDLSRRLFYLSAFRITPQDSYTLTSRALLENRQFGSSGEFSIHYLNVFGSNSVKNQHMLLGDEDQNSLLRQVSMWMDYISPGTNVHVDIDEKIKISELRYSFVEGKDRTNRYLCTNVGFGLTYVLPIIVLLLSAKSGDIVMLENPEAHIHPAGQSKLGELLARATADGIQVIVETHSDHILNGIRLAAKTQILHPEDIQIMFFYKDSEDGGQHKVLFPKVDAHGHLDQWPEGFFDEWDNMLLQLI